MTIDDSTFTLRPGVRVSEAEGFETFVAARSARLLRTAYLLTHDHGLAEDLVQTLYSALSAAGHELAWTEYVTARNPSPDDAATLNIPHGTPALTTRRITRDATHGTPGRPVAMEKTHRSAEDTQLAYLVPAERS